MGREAAEGQSGVRGMGWCRLAGRNCLRQPRWVLETLLRLRASEESASARSVAGQRAGAQRVRYYPAPHEETTERWS